MLQSLTEILNANTYSWTVVVLLAMVSAGFVCSAISNMMYLFIFFPSFVFGGLTGIYAFRYAEVELVREREIGAVIEAAIGMMVTLVALLVLARIIMAVHTATIRPRRTGHRVGQLIVPR